MANKLESDKIEESDLVEFVENHRPRLLSGDYEIKVSQTISAKGNEKADELKRKGLEYPGPNLDDVGKDSFNKAGPKKK